jgi:hypothetical protein
MISSEPIRPGVTACAVCGDTLQQGDSTLTWQLKDSYVHKRCALEQLELERAS